MSTAHLRIYCGPQHAQTGLDEAQTDSSSRTVTVGVMEVLPLLADAVQSERTWLRDFEDDEMTISTDLYEVILAYQHYRRPSA